MWTRLSSSKCGWAFSSVTRLCVAQRVWPMPVVAGGAAVATPPPSSSTGAAASTAPRRRPPPPRPAQPAQVADGADGVEPPVAHDRDARRVVAAVLEPFESRQHERLRRALSHIPDDSAHALQASVR